MTRIAVTHSFRPIAVLTALLFCLASAPALAQDSDPRNTGLEVHLNPHEVMGYESCEKCHAAEIRVWKNTPHHQTFMTLHRMPEAKQIADRMGITSFKTDSECIKCHYTVKANAGELDAVSGISCESCHGAAKNWIEVHNDYGGATRETESPEHRVHRLRESIAGGMRNPINVYLVAQSCYRCHTVPNERLVNVGGHQAGSMDFEIVSWSQGSVRHNFVRTDGASNDPSDRNRLRQMFMAGMIADLEFSLRATAEATQKAEFGINSAKRSARAAKRIAAAQKKLNQPLLNDILAVYKSVTLKLNNREQLLEAANNVNQLGIRFAATVSGDQLEAIDRFIPADSRWK